jgi:hypothetical protein
MVLSFVDIAAIVRPRPRRPVDGSQSRACGAHRRRPTGGVMPGRAGAPPGPRRATTRRVRSSNRAFETDNSGGSMSDDKGNRGSPDRDRIDMNDPDEVRNWTQSLGVSKEQLEEAVRAVGSQAARVREHLGGAGR